MIVRRSAVAVALAVLAVVGVSCDPSDVYRLPVATMGKRCPLEGQFARNATFVLQCTGRKWRFKMSIASAVEQINLYNSRAARGTPEAPLPMATTADLGNGWTVRLTGANLDRPAVWDIVHAASQYTDPPAPDHGYVLVGLEATWSGPGSSRMLGNLVLPTMLTPTGEYEVAPGAQPNKFEFAADVASGQTIRGDVLFMVPNGSTNLRVKIGAFLSGAEAYLGVG